jgi:hypothetical protein
VPRSDATPGLPLAGLRRCGEGSAPDSTCQWTAAASGRCGTLADTVPFGYYYPSASGRRGAVSLSWTWKDTVFVGVKVEVQGLLPLSARLDASTTLAAYATGSEGFPSHCQWQLQFPPKKATLLVAPLAPHLQAHGTGLACRPISLPLTTGTH